MLDSGDLFVGEGDEYDSAFFDKGPKFLHYNPHFVLLSGIEFDHADIYDSLEEVRASFEKLVALLPGDGLLISRFEDTVAMEVSRMALCPVQTFGLREGAMWKLGQVEESMAGFDFEVIYKGRSMGRFHSPLFGEHNLMNILSGIICALNLGNPLEKIRPIVEAFRGVKRRQEILLRNPVLLIDDFAHHPTEVKATLQAVRRRIGAGGLWAVFEPRSATARRGVHQNDYVQAFDSADHVLVSQPYRKETLKDGFSSEQLVAAIRSQGKQAHSFETTDAIVDFLSRHVKHGDTIVVMSNGEFDKIQEKIARAIS